MDRKSPEPKLESSLKLSEDSQINEKRSRDEITTMITPDVLLEEIQRLRSQFLDQDKKIKTMETKIMLVQEENEILKSKINEISIGDPLRYFGDVNATNISFSEESEFLCKIENDEIRFCDLFEESRELTQQVSDVSDFVKHVVFHSHTVMNL